MITRLATLNDLPELICLENEAFPLDGADLDVLFMFITNPKYVTFVAESKADVIGCMVYEEMEKDEIHLLSIAVDQKKRKKGVGFLLMSSLPGFRNTYAETRETNKAMQALFDKFGFVRCGEHKFYYTDDDGEDTVTGFLYKREAAV
jgi:ribosomal protein S18 acetylase RimI-like enzyme